MRNFNIRTVLICLFFSWIYSVNAQDNETITIELGPDEIAFNEVYTITVKVQNGRLKSYDNFPDIPGFIKRGTSSSSSTNIINGQISSSQSITQNYVPEREGTFTVPPFSMKINGKQVSSTGKKVKVGPEKEKRDPFRDPFDDIFNRRDRQQEFVDIQEDAFLALTTNKDEVYVGEGFTATLAFYVAESNRAPLQFYDLGKQLSNILKDLRPSNCWEENFNIENINGEAVTIQGKSYTQYKIYRAAYFPLNLETIRFRPVDLEMIKYKVARNPSFFGRNKKEDFKTFTSKAKTVRVLELPPHPLKDKVAVGDFYIDERISNQEVLTGQSFNYEFNIYGEGNISAIDKPIVKEDGNFDFYDPNVEQNINRKNNRVTGSKSFSYYGIPNEPGTYDLGDYFSWIYFNPNTERYDTLRSELVINAKGESKKNQTIIASDMGSFYDRINLEKNKLVNRDKFANLEIYANLFILLMLGTTAYVMFKK